MASIANACDYLNGDEAPEVWHSVSEMEEDGDSRILGYLFVLASFFRERSPGEEGLISYRSSTLALVRFGNPSHEILVDSHIMGLPDCGGYYLPAMGPPTFGNIMGERPWVRVNSTEMNPQSIECRGLRRRRAW